MDLTLYHMDNKDNNIKNEQKQAQLYLSKFQNMTEGLEQFYELYLLTKIRSQVKKQQKTQIKKNADCQQKIIIKQKKKNKGQSKFERPVMVKVNKVEQNKKQNYEKNVNNIQSQKKKKKFEGIKTKQLKSYQPIRKVQQEQEKNCEILAKENGNGFIPIELLVEEMSILGNNRNIMTNITDKIELENFETFSKKNNNSYEKQQKNIEEKNQGMIHCSSQYIYEDPSEQSRTKKVTKTSREVTADQRHNESLDSFDQWFNSRLVDIKPKQNKVIKFENKILEEITVVKFNNTCHNGSTTQRKFYQPSSKLQKSAKIITNAKSTSPWKKSIMENWKQNYPQ